MRIGFITQLLWSRYGAFWQGLLEDAGFEVCFASQDMTIKALNTGRLAAINSISMRLAAAQALSLAGCDVIIAPDLNANTGSARASAQNPWVARFPESLATFLGLPHVLAVPASLDKLETSVVNIMMALQAEPGRVRSLWERHRRHTQRKHLLEPDWTSMTAQPGPGVVGQPWLLSEALVQTITQDWRVSQHQLDPQLLREAGRGFDAKLAPTDLEVFGAVRLLSRKGAIDSLLWLSDYVSAKDDPIIQRVGSMTVKPLIVIPVQDLVADLGVLIHEASQ